MRTPVRRLATIVCIALSSNTVAARSAVAQAIQGPTYRTRQPGPYQPAVSLTLTAWMAPAGIDGTGAPRYYHWFTGTAVIGCPLYGVTPGSTVTCHAGGGGQFYVAPWNDLPWLAPEPNAPPNPYVGCANCFSYAVSTDDPFVAGVSIINTAATSGTIATTISSFLVPTVQAGGWGYEFSVRDPSGFGGHDRDNFSDIGLLAQVTPAPLATPEPRTWTLLGAGLLGIGLAARRRRAC